MEVAFLKTDQNHWESYPECHGAIVPRWQDDLREGLVYRGDVLTLAQEGRDYAIDFERIWEWGRRRGRGNLLLKAAKGQASRKLIVDACCGQGVDLIVLRRVFERVVGIERHPLVYTLLRDAQRRFSLDGVEVVWGDARDYRGPGEIFYLDPMYPAMVRGKALSHKWMELLKKLCGDSGNVAEAEQLLAALLAPGGRRAIVKRPLRANALLVRRLRGSVEGKLVRFDLY